RHTSSKRDWSSDVCSSDLLKTEDKNVDLSPRNDDYNPDRKDKNIIIRVSEKERNELHELARKSGYKSTSKYLIDCAKDPVIFMRSEERRVGKDCRDRI